MRFAISGVALAALIAAAAPAWAQAPMNPTGPAAGQGTPPPAATAPTPAPAATAPAAPPQAAAPAQSGPMQMSRPGAPAAQSAAPAGTNATQTATARRPHRNVRRAHYPRRYYGQHQYRYYGQRQYGEPGSDFVANQLNGQELNRIDSANRGPAMMVSPGYGPGPGYMPQEYAPAPGYPPPYAYGPPPMGYPPPPWGYRPY